MRGLSFLGAVLIVVALASLSVSGPVAAADVCGPGGCGVQRSVERVTVVQRVSANQPVRASGRRVLAGVARGVRSLVGIRACRRCG